MTKTPAPSPGSTQETWLHAAYDALTEGGVEAVKIMPLAKRLGVTRSGFYWHFKDREALLEAMVRYWEDKNTGNLIARCDAYSETICEAVLNLFDCWLDDTLFDGRLDLAIRNWARVDSGLAARLAHADTRRKAAVQAMFLRFGYAASEAEIRTLTLIYTQIGYLSMQVTEDRALRFSRMHGYVEVFTGQTPTVSELDRFIARHDTAPLPADITP
ncbi:TetR/AcrR family transcriptional regulator [Roseovarius sp. M141]|uniref:TetR/AcrR family transcriptional regulator n=1 Tax=Roseovarius sp. M141 TaxID=2583806 RepID=UPI0020CE0199|nr:TetR/AcrR family transcriptional regulator [Roseovarius sp. M141]MCQ0092433.1 TetR/AcrR family transcriptional regulator [Roseovarius sp. M141]